jgi:PAS domain S-box-containing protein
MTANLRILILEDNQNDADLLNRELKKSGLSFTSEIVQTRAAFEHALQNFNPDLILSDYSLPSFDAVTAFRIKQNKFPHIPFIIVSGVIGEENAVELIKNGVTDYAPKDKLFTLSPKINRALKDTEKRKEKEIIAEKLKKQAVALIIANKELVFQNEEKEKRAAELIIANKELIFQNEEKEKRADELVIANKELIFQTGEKEKRAAELVIADIELDFQNKEKEKREIANRELEAFSNSLKLASQYSLSLIEASRDPLVTISPEGKITDMNQATANITGMTREELTGTDFFDYFTEQQKAREVYQEIFNGSVYKDDKGNVLGVVIVARDVTAQKLLSKYSLSLIEASLDPLVTISTEGKITDMNQATANITGMTREELTGTDFFDYFTERQKARKVYQEVFAKGSVADSPLTLRHKNGKLTDVLFNGSVYKDDRGNVLGVVIVARDVTAQKKLERDVADRENELERLAELERFRKLTVGRELKMIELKKENEELKGKLGIVKDENSYL